MAVGVALGLVVGVALPLGGALPVALGDEPLERVGVGLPDSVVLLESVVEGVAAGVPEPVGVGVPLGLALRVCEGVAAPLPLPLGDARRRLGLGHPGVVGS